MRRALVKFALISLILEAKFKDDTLPALTMECQKRLIRGGLQSSSQGLCEIPK